MTFRVVVVSVLLSVSARAKGFEDYFHEYLMRSAVGLTVQYSKPIGKGFKRLAVKVWRGNKATKTTDQRFPAETAKKTKT